MTVEELKECIKRTLDICSDKYDFENYVTAFIDDATPEEIRINQWLYEYSLETHWFVDIESQFSLGYMLLQIILDINEERPELFAISELENATRKIRVGERGQYVGEVPLINGDDSDGFAMYVLYAWMMYMSEQYPKYGRVAKVLANYRFETKELCAEWKHFISVVKSESFKLKTGGNEIPNEEQSEPAEGGASVTASHSVAAPDHQEAPRAQRKSQKRLKSR